MANNGSVAPRERVNIVYRPATGDARAEVELPLKLLVLGDFTLRDDPTPVEEIKPITIDKDNFNEVMKGQGVSLDVGAPNRLSTSGDPDATLALHLEFRSLADFTPDAIVDQVPELRRLIALRDALKALKGPLGNIPDFRRRLQSLMADEAHRLRLRGELRDDRTRDPAQGAVVDPGGAGAPGHPEAGTPDADNPQQGGDQNG